MNKLTPKQERFAEEYIIDLNATQAAIRAGYSPKGAEVTGAKTLRITKVAEYITKLQNKRSKRTEITQDSVLRELAGIAFSNAADYSQVIKMGELSKVGLTPTDQLDERQQRAMAGVKETQAGIEVKLHDKVKALELLGKHLGMFSGGGIKSPADNNFFDAIENGAREDFDDIPELQPTAADGADLVEESEI